MGDRGGCAGQGTAVGAAIPIPGAVGNLRAADRSRADAGSDFVVVRGVGRRCGESDLVLLEDLARDAAVAIDNARLYREAAEANRIKDQFLGTLSHELRTPLNAILGWAQMLRQRQMSPEKTAVGLETIERNARLQTQMIEDLLDVSRIVSGKVCLKLFPVDLVRIVETAVKALSPDAEARGIELVSFCDEGVSLVRGDATRLQQVVSNLLSNAIKFTPPSGRVEIRLSEDGEPGAGGGVILSGRLRFTLFRSLSEIRELASARSFCPLCSIASAKLTAVLRAITAGWDWDWRSSAISWNSTAAVSGRKSWGRTRIDFRSAAAN